MRRGQERGTVGYTLGVDIGTTYTAIAICRDGRAEIAPLGNRGWSAPSVVFLGSDHTVLVGEPAVRRSVADPLRVVREFKRRIGDQVPLLIGGSPVSADTLTAIVLRAVVQEVVALEPGPPDHVVLTHPANWGPYKTECLWQGLRMAAVDELCPVSLMSEPEAAAAFYASTERLDPGDVIAVYDLGGGTFDAAVLRRTQHGWELAAPAEGIERLGGIDFDQAVLSFVDAATGGRLQGIDPSDPNEQNYEATMAALLRVRGDCVDAKEALSSDTDTTVACDEVVRRNPMQRSCLTAFVSIWIYSGAARCPCDRSSAGPGDDCISPLTEAATAARCAAIVALARSTDPSTMASRMA